MLILQSSLAMAAPCASVVGVEEFRARVSAAWQPGAPAATHERMPQLLGELACLSAPLSAPDAAVLHRVVALDARYVADPLRAAQAVQAAFRLDPAGTTTAVAGTTLADLLPTSDVPALPEPFGTSLAARVFVDGSEVPTRVVGQPAVIQVFDGAGRPVDGAWVGGSAALPDWVVFPDLGCSAETAVADLLSLAGEADRAYAALDVVGFEEALRRVAEGLPCVTTRIGRTQAAAIHRLEGLRQFSHGADDAAFRSFQEARALDPLYEPEASVVRPDTALASLWERALSASSGPFVLERVPSGLELSIDGVLSSARPTALPAIVQVGDGAGAVLWTRYVPPGARLPDFGRLGEYARRTALLAMPPARQRYAELGAHRAAATRRNGLLAASAAAFALGGALYVDNARTYAEWKDLDTPQSRLAELKSEANVTATTSTVFLLCGGGLLTAAFVQR